MPDEKDPKHRLAKFEEDPEYAARIKAEAKKFGKIKDEPAKLAAEFFEAKKLKKVHEKKLSDTNLKIAAIESLLLANFEDQEITSIKDEAGATIFKKSTAYPVVKDKKALFAWIKAHKAAHLIGIVHQSLKAFVNERLQDGESLPPGVEAFLKDSIGHRGGVGGDVD